MAELPASDPARLPQPVHRRVLFVIHNPVLRARGGQRLNRALGWHDPDKLVQAYIEDLRQCSFGYANYEIVERVEVDAFPAKLDGFVYTEEHYLHSLRAGSGFHQPDTVDYLRLLSEFETMPRIASGEIDELWLMAFPYAGYYESIMAGPGAFWCNAPPLAGTGASGRRFVVMGFSFERGVGEMLENFGHRAESIMNQVYAGMRGPANLWERFTRHDLSHPGQAQVGNVHFAPNSQRDYDWGNRRYVPSLCDDWLHFPDFPGQARQVNCVEWGNGDIREHHRWWLRHFPHLAGETDGISHNWWEYVIDPHCCHL